jgi:hypothetical protein
MFALVQNNEFQRFISEGTAFEIDGVQYPQNWLNLSTPEEKAALGIVDVVYGTYPDDVYYWVSQSDPVYVDGVVLVDYTFTPKDLDECKKKDIELTNQEAYSILQPTDWMVIKSTETRSAIPTDWNDWRAQIRLQAANQVIAIKACTTIEELAALPYVEWSKEPEQQ